MSMCIDCGARRGPLCPACVKTAATLGHTADSRLGILGAPPLIPAGHEREGS